MLLRDTHSLPLMCMTCHLFMWGKQNKKTRKTTHITLRRKETSVWLLVVTVCMMFCLFLFFTQSQRLETYWRNKTGKNLRQSRDMAQGRQLTLSGSSSGMSWGLLSFFSCFFFCLICNKGKKEKSSKIYDAFQRGKLETLLICPEAALKRTFSNSNQKKPSHTYTHHFWKSWKSHVLKCSFVLSFHKTSD